MRKSLLLLGLLLLGQWSIAQMDREVLSVVLGEQTYEKGLLETPVPFKSTAIPFHLNGGLIYFKAKLNGVSDTFVLDTGSPGLLLNESVKKDDNNSFAAVGVSGGLLFQRRSGYTFEMGPSLRTDVNSLSANLKHLEKVKKQEFRGMVGYSLLKEHELFLDYKNRLMRLLAGGELMDQKGLYRAESVPVKFQQHFAVLKVKIGKRTYNFGLDTGAEVNIIDKEVAKWLPKKFFELTETIKIRGVSKKGVGADVGEISKCTIANKEVDNMSFVVMDMTVLNEGKNVQLDGLLGYPYLSSELISIDYVSELLYVWKTADELMVRE